MPLSPSVFLGSEDPSPNLLSEASSGYISTSLSTATLSDVYTLSWDLPPLSPGADDVEAVMDKGGYDGEVTHPQCVHPGQAESRDSVLVSKEVASWKTTESTLLESGDTRPESGLNHQDADMPSAVKLKDQESDSDVPCQQEHKKHSLGQHSGSEQTNNSETLKDSPLESLPETEQTDVLKKEPSDLENSQEEVRVRAITVDTEGAASVCNVTVPTAQEVEPETTSETQPPDQDDPAFTKVQNLDTHQSQDVPKVLEPTVDSTGGLGLKVQGTSEPSKPNGTKTSTLSLTTDESKVETSTDASAKAGPDPDPSQSRVAPSKPNTLAANPFKIQKVKSSDLHSFQGIVKKGQDESEQSGPDRSLGAGNTLAVPMESLEIISDSEEGDAPGTVLPDWLKEGEFVTVGTNKCGTVRYVGPTDFAEGTWVGVELETPAGR